MTTHTVTFQMPENLYLRLKQADGAISDTETRALAALRTEADRAMLRKAQAAALLRWRGHPVPPAEKLDSTFLPFQEGIGGDTSGRLQEGTVC